MTAHRLTASSMHHTECLYWARPDVRLPEEPTSRAARLGNCVHAMLEGMLRGHGTPLEYKTEEEKSIALDALKREAELRKWVNRYLDKSGVSAIHSEKGFRFDSREATCTLGPRRGEPGYGEHPEHVFSGTADIIRVDPDKVQVIDLKTGKAANAHTEQLVTLGTMAAVTFKRPKAEVFFLFSKVRSCEPTEPLILNQDSIDAECGRLYQLGKKLESKPEPNRGPWCEANWCKAKTVCPAWERERAEWQLQKAEEAYGF